MLMSLCTDAKMKTNDIKVRKEKKIWIKCPALWKMCDFLEIWFDFLQKDKTVLIYLCKSKIWCVWFFICCDYLH